MIQFNTIGVNIRTNSVAIEISDQLAIQTLSALQKRILVLGIQSAEGGVAPLTPTEIFSAAQAELAFGAGYELTAMLKALKAANPLTECWAVGLAPPEGGVARTFTLTATGPATSDGTIALYIGGELVAVAITTGQTADEIATAIGDQINSQTDLPVTATVTTDVVTCTLKWAGVSGQDLDVRQDYNVGDAAGEPAGVTVTYAAGTSGTGSPDLTTAVAVWGDVQYTHVVTGFTDATALGVLATEMERRWGGMVMQDGLVFGAVCGTQSTMVTLGTAQNEKLLCLMGAGESPTPTWSWAAVVAAIDANEPNPARPRQTLSLPGLLAPAPADLLDQADRNVLLFSGISTYTVDGGGNVNIERLITTYETSAEDVPSTTYLDVTTLETLAAMRFSMAAWIVLKFPRCSLANNGSYIPPGAPIVTPSSIAAALITLFGAWQDAGYVQGTVQQFVEGLTVQRNGDDVNRVDAQISPALMNQFIVFAGQIAFLLEPPASSSSSS